MKKLILSIVFLMYYGIMFSQYSLRHSHNAPRIGDEIIKQQIEYKEVGEEGSDCFWDFKDIQLINEEYSLSYSMPPIMDDTLYVFGYDSIPLNSLGKNEQLIVGIEHNTMYYYLLQNEYLYLLGYENSNVKVKNKAPMLVSSYSENYKTGGQSINEKKYYYESEGFYSGAMPINIRGYITSTVDSYGKMLLPTGDTIRTVRTKTSQIIENDSSNVYRQDFYRWYTDGYRYPIFESIRTTNALNENLLSALSFYYPLQEQFYLSYDQENQSVLDSLKTQQNFEDPDWLEENFSYNYYPNPVSSTLYVDYELQEPAEISISLYSEKTLVKNISLQQQQQGTYKKTLDVLDILPGIYVLHIKVNNYTISNVILKR